MLRKTIENYKFFMQGSLLINYPFFILRKVFWRYLWKRSKDLYWAKKKCKNDITIYDRKFNKLFNEFIAISVNDITIIIYFKLLYLYYFRKFLVENKLGNSLSTPCFNFRNNINIDIEHLPLVLLIQILMIATVFFGKRNEDMRWTTSKMNKSRIIKRVYEIILFYDFNLQFYFYLSINS